MVAGRGGTGMVAEGQAWLLGGCVVKGGMRGEGVCVVKGCVPLARYCIGGVSV